MATKTDLAPVIDASVQTPPTDDEVGGRSIAFMFFNLAHDGALISPWWSRTRDHELRELVRKVDYLSGAVYALESFMTTIPFRIEPKDKSVRAHADLAVKFQESLENGSEFGEGWEVFYSKGVEDLLTQDNGWFFEIIGAGDPLGPIIGMPLGVKHMDARRCQRTGNPEFPVIYTSRDGSIHRLHFTRVGLTSQMPSPDADMNGVGFSAVSRVTNIAINLLDILVFKQEKLGSRPARNLLITQGGLDPETLKTAFTVSEEIMDSQGLSRYSKSVVVGDAALPEADIKSIDLTQLPDGFDEETAVTLGMATIALGFGVDARELFPALSVGATKADALISHVKSRGKAKGQILGLTSRIFGQKVLPPTLKMVFDFQDDVQDKAVADIRKIRSETHEKNLNSGVVDVRVIREQMVSDGDLTREQFIQLELDEGRMEDGTDLLVLFNSKLHKDILNLGVPNPLNVNDNDAEAMLELITDRRVELIEDLSIEGQSGVRKRIIESLAALKRLEAEYEGEKEQEIAEPLLQVENEDEPEGEPNMTEMVVTDEDTSDFKSILKKFKGKLRPKNVKFIEGMADMDMLDLYMLFKMQQTKRPEVVKSNGKDTLKAIEAAIEAIKQMPDQPIIVNVDIPKPDPIIVNVPQGEAPVINVETPKIPVEVTLEGKFEMPDEETVTEKIVARDVQGRVIRTIATTKRKS